MDNYDPNNWNDNNNTNQNQNINGNQHPNQNYFNNDYPVPPAKPKDKLATFSLILAIAGCVTSIVYYISLHVRFQQLYWQSFPAAALDVLKEKRLPVYVLAFPALF